MDRLYLALALIAATVICTGLFSRRIADSPAQEPLIAVAVGFLAGPHVAGLIDLDRLPDPLRFLEEFCRVTLAIALMGVALRLGRRDIRGLWPPTAILVTLGMAGMWIAVALLAAALLGFPFWVALLVGAVAAGTDPVVASAIVTGPLAEKCLPERLRATLSFEAGANDGAAHLLVLLALSMLALEPSQAWRVWLVHVLARGVVLAAAMGAGIGYAAARLLHWARGRGYMERYSYLTFTLSVSLFTLAIGHVVGADSLLSVFVAGLVFDLLSDTGERHDEENVQEAIGKLVTMPAFVLFGALLPVGGWLELGWPLAAFSVAALALRRLPAVASLWPLLRARLTVPDLVFLGWFGPIGVAAIHYAAFAARQAGLDAVWHVGSALILASAIAHGVTAAPLTRLYARRSARRREA